MEPQGKVQDSARFWGEVGGLEEGRGGLNFSFLPSPPAFQAVTVGLNLSIAVAFC